MNGESSLPQQQRAVVELYVRSKWIKANLALEDENVFIEYAHQKRDVQTPTPGQQLAVGNLTNDDTNQTNGLSNNETTDTITSQKRIVKIVKPDNTGLGK
jgi:hypothetical protein